MMKNVVQTRSVALAVRVGALHFLGSTGIFRSFSGFPSKPPVFHVISGKNDVIPDENDIIPGRTLVILRRALVTLGQPLVILRWALVILRRALVTLGWTLVTLDQTLLIPGRALDILRRTLDIGPALEALKKSLLDPEETVWLTQKLISALFDQGRSTITEHLKNIFETGELEEKAVCRDFRHTAEDGKEQP